MHPDRSDQDSIVKKERLRTKAAGDRKQDHLRRGFRLFHDRMQPLLKLAAILRTGDGRGHRNFDDPRVAQKLRALAGCNPLRQPLHDPGLADARFTDADRIGFALLRKNPRHPQNLVLPTDHRLQFAAPRQFGDVPAEKRERRLLLLPGRLRFAPIAYSKPTSHNSFSFSGESLPFLRCCRWFVAHIPSCGFSFHLTGTRQWPNRSL